MCSLTVLPLPLISFKRNYLEECRARRIMRGFELLACREVESLCLQQEDNLVCRDRLLGCECIPTRRLELFLTYRAAGAPDELNMSGTN